MKKKGYQLLDELPTTQKQVKFDPHQSLLATKLATNYTMMLPPSPSRQKAKQPNRTTKTSQKLTLFPEDQDPQLLGAPLEPVVLDAETADEVYNQLAAIPHGRVRSEAERLGKLDRTKLPRVTSYCTASAYRMEALVQYLQQRRLTNGAAPKRFDECLYTPYSYDYHSKPPQSKNGSLKQYSSSDTIAKPDALEQPKSTDVPNQSEMSLSPTDVTLSEVANGIPHVFFFDYGVIVIWGMTEQEERRLLKEISNFEEEKLEADDIETEEFHYHYNASHQPRIYNDIITLKNPTNYLVKLTISHAIAQSVKLTLFERLVADTIDEMKYIPSLMADTGKVQMSRTQITKKIGQLFIMRINVNLVSNILDTPELFWSEPALEPLYTAIRGYLEISQRVDVLNQRVSVISDLLEMLKEHLTSGHSEQLEWIVIILIGFEILVACVTIAVDSYGYVHKGEGL